MEGAMEGCDKQLLRLLYPEKRSLLSDDAAQTNKLLLLSPLDFFGTDPFQVELISLGSRETHTRRLSQGLAIK